MQHVINGNKVTQGVSRKVTSVDVTFGKNNSLLMHYCNIITAVSNKVTM